MSVLPITFEDKEDSPEFIAWLATFGAKKKMTAAEINLLRDAINELHTTKVPIVGGKIPTEYLPTYVDNVLEFANLASLPATGETGKIYVALDTNKTYRWTGSAYVQIGGGEIYIENISVSGGYTVDFNIDTHRIKLTGNTTFTEINLPPVGFSKTITLHINGNFGVVFPASWTQYISGAYNGTAPLNTIVIETIGNERKVQISQPD